MTDSKFITGLKKIFCGTVYTQEEADKRVKRSIICLIISIISLISFTMGMTIYNGNKEDDFFTVVLLVITLTGIPAMIIGASPLGIIKATVAAFRVGKRIIPFYFLDLIVGASLAFIVFCSSFGCPAIIAAYGVYDAYKKRKSFACI